MQAYNPSYMRFLSGALARYPAICLTSCMAILLGIGLAPAQDVPAPGVWGDRGDGTYANPVMPADFSDLDAIRVGADFYAFSSTMQYSPGVVILHSKDLVSWSIAGHVVPDLTALDPELNWDRMGRNGRGVWAGAIRFHAGRFWVYFGTPDQGVYLSQAARVEGPWTTPKLVLEGDGWDDPCPLFDDDGQIYLVATRFAAEGPAQTKYNIHLWKLNPAGDAILAASDRILHQSRGSEANKLYRIHGLYYHYFSEVAREGRVPMMERAKSLDGPWEQHQINHVDARVDKEPNQGGLIELADGTWWFVTHQGKGDWEGRAGVLLPITWVDGWPIAGRIGPDGIGNMVWTAPKPIRSPASATGYVASDDFAERTLKPQWEWRYQPRASSWSLTESPGHLRLHASRPLRPASFQAIPNVLTQRAIRTRASQTTVRMTLASMADGQEAGIAHCATTYASLTVVQTGGARALSFSRNGVRTPGPALAAKAVYLRSQWDFSGQCVFSWSLDGTSFTPIGTPYQLAWGQYRGDRIGLFTQNESADRGSVDFDSFVYTFQN
jgi:beta-xylosidase